MEKMNEIELKSGIQNEEPKFDTKKLESIAKPRSEKTRERIKWLRENRKWLKMSKEIAMNIHYYLRSNNMSQKELADRMNVSPAYIGKVLKGEENLTLETICKIQSALDFNLINVAVPYIIKESLSIEPRMKDMSEDNKSFTFKASTDSSEKYSSSVFNLVS